eukprot:GILJ01014945.1.p1 GENE.GILJ01014945.1~~GILJ01014945.1.p1  ORF type:complete len:1010 (+),score=155.34 GILJ01014945.1:56-3031(+)
MPAIEGGVLAYLGSLMMAHPGSPSVHYLALRLVFCLLHAATPAQLATIAAPIMSALKTFRSSETHLSAPEGSLISRTMIVPSGQAGRCAPAPAQGNLSPHVVQEIHLMATAILSKISFASSLPPELAQHCADQLLAIAKGNENPRLKRIEEEAAKQQLQNRLDLRARQGTSHSGPVPDALVAEIETYFTNRNAEMRKVLAKMAEHAIDAIHDASERFAPSSDLLGPDDDGSCETDESMSALFRPDREKVSKRSLFDSHGSLWLAILEAVGEDMPSNLLAKAQAVVISVASNSTRSQQDRMQRSVEDHTALGGGSTGSTEEALSLLTTNRTHSRSTFFFGLSAMIHVAQYLRLGYKGGWLTSTDEQLVTIYNVYLQVEDAIRSGAKISVAANGEDGWEGPVITSLTPVASGQKLLDELLVALLGTFEYILLNTNITNPTPITRCLGSLLPLRAAQIRRLQQVQLETGSAASGGALANDMESTVLPFLQRSCQIAVVVGRIYNAISPVAALAVANYSPLPTPPTSLMNSRQDAQQGGGLFWQFQNPFAAKTSPISQQQSPVPVITSSTPTPVTFMRSLVLLQCNGLLAYSLVLQEALETLWLTTHTKTRTPTSETDAMTQSLAGHYLFMAKALCPSVTGELTSHLQTAPSNASRLNDDGATFVPPSATSTAIIMLADITEVGTASLNTATSKGISGLVVKYLPKLMYLEPLLTLLMSHPFATAPIGTFVVARAMPTTPTSTRPAREVLTVNIDTATILLESLKEKSVQIPYILRVEKAPRVADQGPATSYVATVAWGIMGIIGSAGRALVTSSEETEFKNKNISQLLFTNYKNAIKLFQEVCVVGPPSRSKEADQLANEFLHDFVIKELLAKQTVPKALYDKPALHALQVALSEATPSTRRASLAAMSDEELKVLAKVWHRYSGVIYDSQQAALIESMFQQELAFLVGRFAGLAPNGTVNTIPSARDLLQKLLAAPGEGPQLAITGPVDANFK